ncbi:ATP-binding protein [Xanthomonas campestris pv. phormiicola]|nr:PAS domain S-box protein [Xanthomonas campestris pv. phormiicola]UYC17480.1 ATP-binding protein [Xanthomonas campestris pv. phormiicola]
MGAIFLVDTFTALEGAIAVLYVVALLLVARTARRSDIVVTAVSGVALTIATYVDTHGVEHLGSQTLRAVVSLAAIAITALLLLQNQTAMKALRAQATLLDLSHDMIFVRDRFGVITFWNRTAEDVYGWSSRQALGRVADELLGTRYPIQRQAIETALLETGAWDGVLEQRTRAGATLVVEGRWVLQRDPQGEPLGVLETHTDVTERKAAYAALVQSERRYRRMFDASRIGIAQQDWTALRAELAALGLNDAAALNAYLADRPHFVERARRLTRIEDLNPAFLCMLGGGSAPRSPTSVDDVLGEGERSFAAALAAFVSGDAFHEGETEIVHVDGHRIPVLFTITFPGPDDDDGCVLVFVVDNSERKQAQRAVLAAQVELAHAARVATLGELTASLAHEVNQPLMAVVTNGEAAMRWLHRDVPDLHEVDAAIARIISEGRRASEIVRSVRDFLSKAPMKRDALSAARLVEDAVRLVEHEFARGRVEVQVELQPDLPAVVGDRIQLQQVLVNLMVNASQAMAEQPALRLLRVRATRLAHDEVAITVADTGPGIAAEHLDRLFDPFFTTKQQGMGMGLAICRTTAEAHGGRLSVESQPGSGASFRLVLSATRDGAGA